MYIHIELSFSLVPTQHERTLVSTEFVFHMHLHYILCFVLAIPIWTTHYLVNGFGYSKQLLFIKTLQY